MKTLIIDTETTGLNESLNEVLTVSGLRGTLGGTALKNILIGLVKPSKEARKILSRFNLEGLTIAETLKKIKEGTNLKEFSTVFNLRAVATYNLRKVLRDENNS